MTRTVRVGPVTVAEALELPVLQRGLPELLAGEERLGSPVRWVHAGEVPNIAALLTGGELLLTTGMGLGDVGRSRTFIDALADRGVAALVVELGTALTQIPEQMRRAAVDRSLPFVALHREVPFVQVTEAVHTELVNRQYGLLKEGEEIQQRLISVMLGGDGLPELLAELSSVVGNPVFLTSPTGQLLFHAGSGDDLEAWEAVSAGSCALGLQHAVPMGPSSTPGRLLVLPTRRETNEIDAVALRHACGIVALALLRAREEEELIVRERGNLLFDLSEGVVSGVRGRLLMENDGFRAVRGALVAIAIREVPASPGPARAALAGDVQRELAGRGFPILIGATSAKDQMLALSVVSGRKRRDAELASIADVLTTAWSRRRPHTRAILVFDGPVEWDAAGLALASVIRTANAIDVSAEPRPWYDARFMQLERLLGSVVGTGELERFVEDMLGPLLRHDAVRMLKLLPTLVVLCRNSGRKAESARELHLHRQALYHRLRKLESLLDCDLSDGATLAKMHVAVRALEFLPAG